MKTTHKPNVEQNNLEPNLNLQTLHDRRIGYVHIIAVLGSANMYTIVDALVLEILKYDSFVDVGDGDAQVDAKSSEPTDEPSTSCNDWIARDYEAARYASHPKKADGLPTFNDSLCHPG
ncbi:hypothetical protein K438DRAFT_1996251 [Mycena galopus ATCC 62051]|nr:hypothetical protein K438DRAFT_1996251 [Mycena galopus ATCC 62051]